jgi:hypothetical protein
MYLINVTYYHSNLHNLSEKVHASSFVPLLAYLAIQFPIYLVTKRNTIKHTQSLQITPNLSLKLEFT